MANHPSIHLASSASCSRFAARIGAHHRTMLLLASLLAMSACGGESKPNTNDAGGDGSTPMDAGQDSGSNGGTDAGQDSGNGGTDAGQDAGQDAGFDAGFDAGSPDMCPPGSSTATATAFCTVLCGSIVTTCSLPLPDGGGCMSMCETMYGDPNTTAFQRGRMLDCLNGITSAAECNAGFACLNQAQYCP